ncbi:MAG: hypothetical protein H7A25_21205 [Leptospiraceae bacterium]|nr:hypothetical protein [Leptospiraceae bacterium]MCP5502429.1 hypothetical protein [Leptospiraceae bacterium]
MDNIVSGSPRGAKASAGFYTLVINAALCGLEPQKYLEPSFMKSSIIRISIRQIGLPGLLQADKFEGGVYRRVNPSVGETGK